MTELKNDPTNERTLDALGTLLLSPRDGESGDKLANVVAYVKELSPLQFEDLLNQAEKQRVLRRVLDVLKRGSIAEKHGCVEIIDSRLTAEKERAQKVLEAIQRIVYHFDRRACPVLVMKTLDHWPDTGSDIDLLAAGEDQEVCKIFESDLQAERQFQSWGDRLAHKFNFRLEGLGELVEVHIGCLGQTGEQKKLAAGVLSRGVKQPYGDCVVPVPTPEDRIIIATLQRMYRHYYIRLTDIVNISRSLAEQRVDVDKLKSIAEASSIWPGVATLLLIVCQRAAKFGAPPVSLPGFVVREARFNSARTYVDQKFVRVPLLPEAANLFFSQIADNGRRREYRAMARLSLLPVLATAAFVSFRVTGNDKGIW